MVTNSQTSTKREVTVGVSQVSILAPLLFILYMNAIVKQVVIGVRLYADDVTLFVNNKKLAQMWKK